MGRDDMKTPNDIHAADVFGWPLMMAMLERIGPWAPYALRVGILQLIRGCLAEMVDRQATADRVADLRELVEALAHMPFYNREMNE